MVHDPRVTVLLSRLGGLYRDPARIDRDAASLLKSSVGANLTPGIAPLVENNGDSAHCLVLQGTIAIVFRGNTYQLLVDIYLPPGYPIRPPVSFIRLAQNMYLKENHPHVGNDGMVYMPYTHEWNQRTHSLIEMVVAMSSVFSADPPVFTRTSPAPAPAPPPRPVANNLPPPAYDSGYIGPNSGSTDTSAESERYIQEQIAAIMAKEAEEVMAKEAQEANRAAEIARKAAKDEEEAKQTLAKQKLWEQQKQARIKEQVAQKIQAHLQRKKKECEANFQADWRDQHYLKHSKTKVEEEIEQLSKTKDELQKYIATVDTKTTEIKEWLGDHAESKHNEPSSVDDLCQPVSKVHAQMLDLSAENAALSDTLYFLDRGMYSGHIDCTTHLKTVRKLAKRQFLIRAHLIRIDEMLGQKNR
jgi:ESCRT-I complex subunit TSG101